MFQLESEDKKIRWPSSKNIKQKNSWYPSLKTIRKEVSSLIKEGQPFCFIQTFNWLMRPTQIRESNLICYWSTAKSCPNLCNPTDSSTPGFPILHIAQSFLKLMSTESVMPSNHLILCYSLLLLPSIFPSIKVFSHDLALHIRWPKCWSFNFSISPSNEYSGLISFRTDWFDLLQHHSFKTSVLQCSAFSMVQLLHLYATTGKKT